MKLIVGLGNPGEKYRDTRHNLGFMVLDHFLRDVSESPDVIWSRQDKLKCESVKISYRDEQVLLVRPQTYMNLSGMAVRLVRDFYKTPDEDIWIVHDELDLPLGAMKIRFGGAAAGHHGVESVISELGTDKFWRYRLGIGDFNTHGEKTKVRDAEGFVLGLFTGHEQGELKKIIKRANDALQAALADGTEAAMNRYNTK